MGLSVTSVQLKDNWYTLLVIVDLLSSVYQLTENVPGLFGFWCRGEIGGWCAGPVGDIAPSRLGGITSLGGEVISSGTVAVFEVQVSTDIGSFPSTDDKLFFSNC